MSRSKQPTPAAPTALAGDLFSICREARVEPVVIEAGTRFRGHGHDQAHLFVLADGAYRERYGSRHRNFGHGQVRFSPPGDEHHMVFERDCKGVVITLPIDQRPAMFRERVTPHVATTADAAMRLRTASMRRDPLATIDLQLVLLELLCTGARWASGDQRSIPPWLNHARNWIRRSAGASLDVRRLGREIGYHPTYLAREFRRFFGLAPSEYARLARAQMAAGLLTESRLPLTQVALNAGFSDQSHLTRSINRYFGCTPGRLRRSISS